MPVSIIFIQAKQIDGAASILCLPVNDAEGLH